MSINKVILIGNCCKDPEIRNTNDGREIASFSLATNESWKDKNSGEKKDKVEFHRIVVFSSGLAGVVKNYVKKGSKLYIEGQLQTRKWTDKDGTDKYTTEIVLQGFNAKIELLDGKKGDQQSSSEEDDSFEKPAKPVNAHNKAKGNGYVKEAEDLDDDLPF